MQLINCVIANFPPTTRLAILGTIQFVASVHAAREKLDSHFGRVWIPQVRSSCTCLQLGAARQTLLRGVRPTVTAGLLTCTRS